MKKDHIYTLTIIGCILAGLVIALTWSSRQSTKRSLERDNRIQKIQMQYDSLRKAHDSLQSELFVMNISLQRYEYIMEQLEEAPGSDCKQQFKEILKHTE